MSRLCLAARRFAASRSAGCRRTLAALGCLGGSLEIFTFKGIRQVHITISLLQILFMQELDFGEMVLQRLLKWLRQHCHAVLSALAIPHDDLLVGEIGVPAFPLWQRLGLLSFVVLTLPELGLAEIVDDMACDT